MCAYYFLSSVTLKLCTFQLFSLYCYWPFPSGVCWDSVGY